MNILGLVSCADLELSTYLKGTQPPMIAFQRLVLNVTRAGGQPLFRLAEDSLFILVSEKVKSRIEGASLVGVRLEPIESRASSAVGVARHRKLIPLSVLPLGAGMLAVSG